MRTTSLVRRTVLAVLALELFCAIAFSGLALWHERRSRMHAFDAVLQGRSDSLLGAVQDAEDPEDNVTIDPTELRLPPEDVYAVFNQGGREVGSSVAAPPGLVARGADGFRTERVGNLEYRVLQREAMRIIDRAENAGIGLRRPVTILYAAPTGPIHHEIVEAASFYVLVSVLLVSTTTLLLLTATRRLLRPISALADAAAAVNMTTLTFEAPPETLRVRELKPLVGALSDTVNRLRDAIEAQHRFVGDAAHELKTAVAVARSSIQLLGMRPRTAEEYKEGLDRILTDNERVEGLVSSMLRIARFEEGAATGELCDFSATAKATISRFDPLAESRGISLQCFITPAVEARLTREATDTLVSNLLMNAIQHSPRESQVSIIVRGDNTRDRAVLEIADAGAGIAPASLPHIFERFYREDASRSRETGGAGLGLAICKSIVDRAGGTIEVTSTVGKGTSVIVSLPSV